MVWILCLAGCHRAAPVDVETPPAPMASIDPVGLGIALDADGDGFWYTVDCDDHDATRYPGAPEACDGIDSDCVPDLTEQDLDQDGVLVCANDCDDLDPTRHPGASDDEDGIDQNCDGTDGIALPSDSEVSNPILLTRFGYAVASVDADLDGTDELVVGAPGGFTGFEGPDGPGRVYLLDDTTITDQLESGFPDATFGVAVTTTATSPARVGVVGWMWEGDGRVDVYPVDGDGFGEVVLSIRGGDQGIEGAAFVGDWLVVGSDAGGTSPTRLALIPSLQVGIRSIDEVVNVMQTDSTSSMAGRVLRDVGDRDGDGLVDLGVGARSAVYVATPDLHTVLEEALETWTAAVDGWFGMELAGGTDLDGDGRPELALGTSEDPDRYGIVQIVGWVGPGSRDAASAALATVTGEFAGDQAISPALVDADLDGIGDLVVGSADPSGPGKAMLFLGPLSGQLGREDAAAVCAGPESRSEAGRHVLTGDFDGDALPDLAYTAPEHHEGTVFFVHGFGG